MVVVGSGMGGSGGLGSGIVDISVTFLFKEVEHHRKRRL